MSKITGTIYNKSKNYFMKKANNIYTKDKTKPKWAKLNSYQYGFSDMNYLSNVGPIKHIHTFQSFSFTC